MTQQNKTILITGSSSGIGRATAEYFQEKGWNVIATMRSPDKETKLNKLTNVLVTELDVTKFDTINEAISKGIDKFGKIDAVLNNAGYGAYGPLESFPRENIIREFDTNVIGLLDVSRAIIPHFRKNKDGVLINVSSVGGKATFPFGSLYHGTKFAVEGITEALSFELDCIGAKAKIIEPGTIVTDFAGRSFDFCNDESIPEYQPLINAMLSGIQDVTTDANRASPPSAVAEVVYEAATDGKNTLRYTAGADAGIFLDLRQGANDEEYVSAIKKRFGF